MDNRNQPGTPRRRRDSITNEQRRGMQQGYPLREDATLTIDRPVNRPSGPREVPQSMRQGKIPVRQNANTGRTYPVMNRNGQKSGSVPAELQTQPVEKKIRKAYDFDAEELALSAPVVPASVENVTDPDTEPVIVPVPEQTAESSDLSDLSELEIQVLTPEETVPSTDAAEKNPEPSADAVQNPTENTVESSLPSEEAVESAPETSEEASKDIPSDTPDNQSDTAEEDTELSADTVQDPLEATREFSRISNPAAVPVIDAASEQAEELPAVTAPLTQTLSDRMQKMQNDADKSSDVTVPLAEEPEQPAASGSLKNIWMLPLIIAILAALAMCIGIPAAMSSGSTEPDFDMSVRYDNLLPDENDHGELDETSGVGREEAPETNVPEPEITPVPAKFNVTLTFYDRDPILISTSEITLGALLEQVNYTVLDSDRFPMDFSTTLTEEIVIDVETVTYGTDTETVTIPFETKTTNVQTIPRGQKNVTQYGQNGTKVITYTTEIVNGVEVGRTVAGETITKEPVTETYQLGVGGTLVGNDGNTYSYSYYRYVNATYYDIEGLTYLGYNADESVVAVDMDYIPLGTKIYVKNDQFDFGVRTAADTGSMIEGWEVDIWLGDSNPQKAAFAQIGYVKNMVIYYLD